MAMVTGTFCDYKYVYQYIVQLCIFLHFVTHCCDSKKLTSVHCGTNSTLSVSWAHIPPYISRNDTENELSGGLYNAIENMVTECCGTSYLTEYSSSQVNARAVEENLEHEVLAYPVHRTPGAVTLDRSIPNWNFIPVIDSPGSMVLVNLEKSQGILFSSLEGTWPLGLLVLTSAGLAGILIWLLDRSFNPDEFPKPFVRGFWEGTWWAFVTMTTVGYGDRAPRSIAGRAFGFIWMITGIILMSVFTATLTSAFTAETNTMLSIKGLTVGVSRGTHEERMAFMEGGIPRSYDTITDIIENLSSQDSTLDAALVDIVYALHNAELLTSNGITSIGILRHELLYGFIARNLPQDAINCFAEYTAYNRHKAHDHIVGNVGAFSRSRGEISNGISRNILHSHVFVVYIMIGIWILLMIVFIIWEYTYRERKEKLKKEQREAPSEYTPIMPKQVYRHEWMICRVVRSRHKWSSN